MSNPIGRQRALGYPGENLDLTSIDGFKNTICLYHPDQYIDILTGALEGFPDSTPPTLLQAMIDVERGLVSDGIAVLLGNSLNYSGVKVLKDNGWKPTQKVREDLLDCIKNGSFPNHPMYSHILTLFVPEE